MKAHAARTIEELIALGKERGYAMPSQWAARMAERRRLKRPCLCGARQQPDGTLPCGH